MTHSELIEQVAATTKVPKTKVAAVLLAFIETTKEALKAGEQVTLFGFGVFYPHEGKLKGALKDRETEVSRTIRFKQSRRGRPSWRSSVSSTTTRR